MSPDTICDIGDVIRYRRHICGIGMRRGEGRVEAINHSQISPYIQRGEADLTMTTPSTFPLLRPILSRTTSGTFLEILL